MTKKREEVPPLEQAARDKASWLLFRYADPRIRRAVHVRGMENGMAYDVRTLELERTDGGHELLEQLEAAAPGLAELLVAACIARDNTTASSRAREAVAVLLLRRFPGQGIVRDAELVDG